MTVEAAITNGRKITRELFGLFLLFWGLLVLLSLVTYSQSDPSLNHAVSSASPIQNSAGLFGAYISGLLVDIFGFSAFLWPAVFLLWGAGCVSAWLTIRWWRWCGLVLFAACLLSLGAAWNLGINDARGGGMLGTALYEQVTLFLNPVGATLLWLFLLFISLELGLGIAWLNLIQKGWGRLYTRFGDKECWARMSDSLTAVRESIPKVAFPRHRSAEKENVIPLFEVHEDDLEQQVSSSASPRKEPLSFTLETPTPSDTGSMPNSALLLSLTSPEPPLLDLHGSAQAEQPSAPIPHPVTRTVQKPLPVVYPTDAQIPPAPAQASLTLQAESRATPAAPEILSLNPDSAPAAGAPVLPIAEKVLPLERTLEQAPAATQASRFPISGEPASQQIQISHRVQTPQVPTEQPQTTQAQQAPVLHSRVYPMPPIDLLAQPQESDSLPSPEILEEQSERLMTCLSEFNIQGELVRVTPGPVITLFEIRPAPGVRVGRFTNLTDDLARSLLAEAIRIQAPVPGCDTVGVEIPNLHRSTVNFRALIESEAFRNSFSLLTMALGKDIEGRPAVRDLATMPHVLVAGTTGSGKSVCLNSILVSFLYKASPDEVKLMLVDPKRVEMAMYADLPHLVHPVVTETSLAKTALEWAVHEMDQRYDMLARFGVKHVKDFNKKLKAFGANVPPQFADLKPLPYLVIVIDELADLMMTAGKDVEGCIVRLAQLARAAGIHLIVATQRPSVDVVTGLIKANFPCRISFQVANKYDSRTILDTAGAEQLLGKGDMLFKPTGGKLQRLHGPFVTDEEVQAVAEYWKSQKAPQYEVDFTEWGNSVAEAKTVPSAGSSSASNDEEALYAEAVTFVQEQGRMSISLLQRRFRIGFNKAARFVERMEQDGILPPASRSNKARQVNPQD